MKYTYLCRKYNPYDDFNLCPIVDETEMLSSPAYLHIFENKVSSEKYCVIPIALVPLCHVCQLMANLLLELLTMCILLISPQEK